SQGGWRALLRAERRSHRQDPPAGNLRQSVLRRQEAQPPVHDSEHLGVCDLCRDPGFLEAVRFRSITAGWVEPPGPGPMAGSGWTRRARPVPRWPFLKGDGSPDCGYWIVRSDRAMIKARANDTE